MELEKQVCSLALAKKLKELGVKQDSLFWWHPIPKILPDSGGTVVSNGYDISYAETGRFFGSGAKISAFTVAELGEMLPQFIIKKGRNEARGEDWEQNYTLHTYKERGTNLSSICPSTGRWHYEQIRLPFLFVRYSEYRSRRPRQNAHLPRRE